jgi:PAS domain S-box-containing protein
VTIGIRFNDGTTTWALYSAAPLLDPVTSEVAGAVVTFQDITVSRESQKQLREVEERYRQLVEFNPDAIFVHDGERFVYANAEAVRLYGASSQEDLIGRRILDLVLPEDREFISNRIKNLMSSQWKFSPRRQTRILRIDGKVADVDAVGTRVQFDGKPAIQVVLHDVSDRERADQALREERERLMTVITTAPIVLWVTDTEGVTKISEGRALETLGLRGGEVVGRNVFEMYAEHQGITAAHRRALQGESVLETVEVQGLVFESRIMPLRDAAGRSPAYWELPRHHRSTPCRAIATVSERDCPIIANTPTRGHRRLRHRGRVLS